MKLPKVYEPSLYEGDIYALWEKSQAFQPVKAGKRYSVVVPPPNANGNLHIGHALTLAIEDIAVRYHRMKGEQALLLPGADHAGFETQVVYERHLAKEGKSRFDFTREELYSQIWNFVAKNRENYENQFRQLGTSVDWSRFTFTLDQKIVKRAYATFKKMWEEGLIYRGERLVNYCTFHRTGFADIEVDFKETKAPLYYLKYGPFTLATTRPETKFGDTAVAVHPEDTRYQEWIGQTITVEGVNGDFEVRVVADEMVDPHFGTGAVKITPAHSFDDWEVAERHNLAAVRIINHDGTMNHKAGRFEGMTVLEARKAVVKALKEKDLLVKVDDDYQTRVGQCYKCGTIIEPMLMKQWFVDMKPLADPAIKALNGNKIVFHPDSKKRQLITYLEGLRDWNISRQIAWGIPIPAFQNINDTDDWIYDERVDQEIIEVDGKKYRRDPDVFDTWFSSSSWPYATLDYPDSDDAKEFYPLSLMETGFDILYPWVSRMLMLGLYVTGEVPFKTVYLHGLVLDEHGQKMSKSKGNVVNPMDVVQEHGSDAMRMGIIAGQSAGNNQPFGMSKVIAARNFANKLWNIARFIEGKVGDIKTLDDIKPQTDADHWLLFKLQQSIERVGGELDEYRYAEAYDRLYHFVWDDFADWYLEASKASDNVALLGHTLSCVLKLLHPFAPFVTETIWQTLAWKKEPLLATSQWPKADDLDKADLSSVKRFETVKAIVTELRVIYKNIGITKGNLEYTASEAISSNTDVLKRMGRLTEIRELTDSNGLRLTSTVGEACWLAIDPDTAKQYADALDDKFIQQNTVVERLEARLRNKSYVDNAPEAVVAQTRQQLEETKTQLEAIKAEADRFKA